jgi:hypothetical protein
VSSGLGEDIEVQLKTQGVASYKVDDGEVFVFSTAILEKMLEQSRDQGKVIVFVKTRPGA